MEQINTMTTRINPVATLAVEGDIALLCVDSPPVNALSLAVREGILGGLEKALSDPVVSAVILICGGRTFFAGADISEFGKPLQLPTLWDVIDALDAAGKPIIAAIHGTALGGGFEVALACHYRIADPAAKFGFPEVTLGILPAAGGTQRLPRLVSPDDALEMIVGGGPIDAGTALAKGIVDELAPPAELREGAIAFARRIAADGRPLRRISDEALKLDDAGVFDRYRQANARKMQGLDAPEACVKAIEAAYQRPFADGIALERQLFAQLVAGPQAAALRHVFFAERQVGNLPDISSDIRPLPVETIGVIGAGTMGSGIAMCFLNAGFPVTIVETSAEALNRGLDGIRASYDAQAARGRLTRKETEDRYSRLSGATDMADLVHCDLIVEAVYEDMAVKKQIFGQLDAVAKPEAILATNTSFLDVDEIASATTRPHMILGLHFFSPANIMRLLEVVRGPRTDRRVVATALALGRRLGKVAVPVGNCHGFVGNRILAARQSEAERLMLEGTAPWDIDRVHAAFGMPMGPFAMYDLAGLDLGWSLEASKGETVVERLCEADRRGQKTGAGFYDYDEKRRATPSHVTEGIIAEVAARAGIVQRPSSDDEIWRRCTWRMINEAARILEDGMATRASDIDTIWINGYGWPRHTGGLLYYADAVGLAPILSGLSEFERRYGADFTPAALLERLMIEGRSFSER